MRPEPLVLRPAVQADIPRLVEVARRSWLSAFSQTAPFAMIQAWSAADRESRWYLEHWPRMLVAESRGVVIGLVQPDADEINGLWVLPGAQGQGVGTALLRAAEQTIRAAGHPRAWLICSGFNPRAQRFYRKHGYAVVQRHYEPLAGGVMEELLVFEKPLVPAYLLT